MDTPSPDLVALLAACRARPADDLPRLVLADWLDENGQPERAEFVRVQVELSHKSADAKRTAELRRREAELLRDHQAEWAGSFLAARVALTPHRLPNERRYSGPFPPQHTFHRGMLRVPDVVPFLGRPELREWFHGHEMAWVEQIELRYSRTHDFVKAELPDESFGRVALTLNRPAVADRSAFRLLAVSSNFAAVRSLSVVGVEGELVLEEITRADVSGLVTVSVAGDVSQRAAGLIASAPFTSLSSLDIGRITEPGLRALIASPYLGNLTELNLIGSPIGNAGMVALCKSRLAETLRAVEFPNTGIGDAGVVALVRSPLFAHMHGPRLNLMMNRIGDDGLKAIAESEHLLRFRELVLKSGFGGDPNQTNHVGDDGVIALAESPHAANLQFLDFSRNRITDRGAFTLARSPHLKQVIDLCVKENGLTFAGVAALHERFGEAVKT